MANFVWVLSERSNVNAKGSSHSLKEGKELAALRTYSCFENAKRDMLRLIRAYAKTDNGLFDGDGNIVGFREYFNEIREINIFPEEPKTEKEAAVFNLMSELQGDYGDTETSFRQVETVPALLREWLTEAPGFTPDRISEGSYTDHMLGVKASSEQISAEGVGEGPFHFIDPYILINTFNMDDPEKEYNFRVRNTFGEQYYEPERFVYIDLIKVEVDAEFEY